ncbi:hypothetical protein Efla_004630 [Eimeria flavescens]
MSSAAVLLKRTTVAIMDFWLVIDCTLGARYWWPSLWERVCRFLRTCVFNLAFTDKHTRWARLVSLPNPTAALLGEVQHQYQPLRSPPLPASHNGSQVLPHLHKQLCSIFGINKRFAALISASLLRESTLGQ